MNDGPTEEEIARVLDYASTQLGWGKHVRPYSTIADLRDYIEDTKFLYTAEGRCEAEEAVVNALAEAERRGHPATWEKAIHLAEVAIWTLAATPTVPVGEQVKLLDPPAEVPPE